MKVYNANPDQVKPLPRATQLHYVDAFDSDFAFLLRERRSATLTDMMNDSIEVEVNLMASQKMNQRTKTEKNKFKEESQPSTSQYLDVKLDMMLKNMEKLVDKLLLDNKPTNKEQEEP